MHLRARVDYSSRGMPLLDEQDAFGILQTVEQLAAFNATAKALMATSDMAGVFEVVERTVPALLGNCSWALLLCDEATGRLKLEAGSTDVLEPMQTLTLPFRAPAATQVVATTLPLETSSVTDQSCFFRVLGPMPRAVLTLPLQVRSSIVGALELASDNTAPLFSAEQRRAAVAIADLTALAIENATTLQRLAALSVHDEHTGLYNARRLNSELLREIQRMGRFKRPLSLLFLDLDRFKQINDTHGHLVGSAVLREVGVVLQSAIRRCDSAYRYGGDEFAVLLLETDAPSAEVVARRIHERLRAQHFSGGQQLSLRLSASIGVTTVLGDGVTPAEMIHQADHAMYCVKAAGRNNVAFFDSSELPAPGAGAPKSELR